MFTPNDFVSSSRRLGIWVRNMDFSGLSLQDIQFGNSRVISNCSFMGCDFTDLNFSGIEFQDCRFAGSKFVRTILRDTRFRHCNFRSTYWDNVDSTFSSYYSSWEHADLRRTRIMVNGQRGLIGETSGR